MEDVQKNNEAGAPLQEMILELLGRTMPDGSDAAPAALAMQPLFGDGSTRRFFRITRNERPYGIAVVPGGDKARDLAEARSALVIGRHLHRAGVPVPAILAADEQSGLIIFEDLGDCRLHDLLRRDRPRALACYPEIIRRLVRMQVDGMIDFSRRWCYDTEEYDEQVMVERESLYFLDACWQNTLAGETVPALTDEFRRLARQAAENFELLFLHRDFQSRNIMVTDERVCFIDFQAGRLGPPGYDLASLLIDPYAALPDRLQQELLEYYLQEAAQTDIIDPRKLRRSYPLLAVQRNLQIIGAFAYLAGVRGKPFFRSYLLPALIALHNRLADPLFADYGALRATVSSAITRYRDITTK